MNDDKIKNMIEIINELTFAELKDKETIEQLSNLHKLLTDLFQLIKQNRKPLNI